MCGTLNAQTCKCACKAGWTGNDCAGELHLYTVVDVYAAYAACTLQNVNTIVLPSQQAISRNAHKTATRPRMTYYTRRLPIGHFHPRSSAVPCLSSVSTFLFLPIGHFHSQSSAVLRLSSVYTTARSSPLRLSPLRLSCLSPIRLSSLRLSSLSLSSIRLSPLRLSCLSSLRLSPPRLTSPRPSPLRPSPLRLSPLRPPLSTTFLVSGITIYVCRHYYVFCSGAARCRDLSDTCNKGWPPSWCTSQYQYVLDNCPLMCGKCSKYSTSTAPRHMHIRKYRLTFIFTTT